MAKQDYSIDIGMWAVQPGSGANPDAILDTLVPHFEKVWDGHSCPPKRACNVLMTYGNRDAWGWLGDDDKETRAEAHAYAFGEYLLRVKEANASSGGAGAPRYLSAIVFRGMWNLLHVNPQNEDPWTPSEIQQMANYFLEYFGGVGDPLPENNGNLNWDDLSLLKGYLLGDDFAKYPYNCSWDEIVQRVHTSQQAYSVDRPFYFSHQGFSTALWDNSKPYGQRMNALKDWLNVFNNVGATPVFLPQYYPWEGGRWDYHDERDPYTRWPFVLDELLELKNNYYQLLQVQPVIQAFADEKAGPGHPDIHNQLRAVLNHEVVDGVWLLGWNYPGYTWMAYLGQDNRWKDKQHIAEAIQVEVGGSPEVILTSVPDSGMTGADPQNLYPQPKRDKGPGGTRLKFNLSNRQEIWIQIEPVGSDEVTRTLLDGYDWSGRYYSFGGPWGVGQYTRNPKVAPDDPSLNPLHGTSVNWNGWTEQDLGKAPVGDYDVQLKDINGHNLGTTITVNIVPQIISIAENWNLISFTVNKCFYQDEPPTVFIPEGVELVNISDLGFTYMADWFTSILEPNNPIENPWRVVQGALPGGAAVVMDSTVPPRFHTLKFMSAGYGYWIKMNESSGGGTITLEGSRLAPNTVLSLAAEWNLVGYLPFVGYYDTPQPPDESLLYVDPEGWTQKPEPVVNYVFSSIEGQWRIIIGARPGGASISADSTVPPRFWTLNDTSPGYGYWIKVYNNVDLIYPADDSLSGAMISMPPCKIVSPRKTSVKPTNVVMFIHGGVSLDDKPAPVGSRITVWTPSGVLVGEGTVDRTGEYEFLPIYGNDITTPELDGAQMNDELIVKVDGHPVSKSIRWLGDRTIQQVDLVAKTNVK